MLQTIKGKISILDEVIEIKLYIFLKRVKEDRVDHTTRSGACPGLDPGASATRLLWVFRSPVAISFGDDQGTVYGFGIGDFNKDGQPDIAATRSGAANVVYLANTLHKK